MKSAKFIFTQDRFCHYDVIGTELCMHVPSQLPNPNLFISLVLIELKLKSQRWTKNQSWMVLNQEYPWKHYTNNTITSLMQVDHINWLIKETREMSKITFADKLEKGKVLKELMVFCTARSRLS